MPALVSLKACREANISESTDNAGVIGPPPILYLGELMALIVLRWFWPAPILASASLALYLGVALGVLALGLGLWAVVSMRMAGTLRLTGDDRWWMGHLNFSVRSR